MFHISLKARYPKTYLYSHPFGTQLLRLIINKDKYFQFIFNWK